MCVKTASSYGMHAACLTSLCRNPDLWNESTLTPAGKAFIQNTTLTSLLASVGGGIRLDCPFLVPNAPGCPPPSVGSIQVWAWDNLLDFVGLDSVIQPFFDSGVRGPHLRCCCKRSAPLPVPG